MKKFVKWIKAMQEVRYDLVLEKLISEKIPCAIFSSAPISNALELLENVRKNGMNMNITHLITVNTPPQL